MLTQVMLLLALGDSPEPPTEFRILGKGANKTSKGTVVFDDTASKLVLSAFADHGADLMVDYEHKSILKLGAPVDGGKAAGWFKPAVKNGELWATDVQWTDAAKAALKAREYRYFSPALLHDASGRVHKLVNVALTNLPATKGLRALVADETPSTKERNPTMEPTETELALFAALNESKSLSAALGVITALKEEAAKVVALSAANKKLETELNTLKVTALLNAAKDEGRVSEAEMPKLLEQGIKDVAWLEGYLPTKTASPVAKPEHKEPKGGAGDGKLTATEQKFCRLYGITPEDFTKEKLRLAELDAADEARNAEMN